MIKGNCLEFRGKFIIKVYLFIIDIEVDWRNLIIKAKLFIIADILIDWRNFIIKTGDIDFKEINLFIKHFKTIKLVKKGFIIIMIKICFKSFKLYLICLK